MKQGLPMLLLGGLLVFVIVFHPEQGWLAIGIILAILLLVWYWWRRHQAKLDSTERVWLHQIERIAHILPIWKDNLSLACQLNEQGGERWLIQLSLLTGNMQKQMQEDGELLEYLQQSKKDQPTGSNQDMDSQAQFLYQRLQQRHQQTRNLLQELTELLVLAQYHDRVGQIVGHVEHDLDKLLAKLKEMAANHLLGEPLAEIALEHWLAELENAYTTIEQKSLGRGQVSDQSEQNDITLF